MSVDPPTSTELIDNYYFNAYVDDLALLISGEHQTELESRGNKLFN